MKFSLILFIGIAVLLASCNSGQSTYSPNERLTESEQKAILALTVRNYAKRPSGVGEDDELDSLHDAYYDEKIKNSKLELYYPKDDYYYFLVSQVAPSMLGKRHATGGRFKLNDQSELIEYEETFRTWKLLPDTLQKRGLLLFDKMVKAEPLEGYQTKNSKGIEFIEFPDDLNYYHKVERKWKIK